MQSLFLTISRVEKCEKQPCQIIMQLLDPCLFLSIRNIVQAICAQKPLNQAKLSTSMTLSTMLGHHMGTNFRYGAMQKIQHFYRGGHFCSAITAFQIFGHISTIN